MIRTFKAPTMTEAMQLAKDFFGDDAIVLQSRKVTDPALAKTDDDEVVEITVSSEKPATELKKAKPAKVLYSPADANRKPKLQKQPPAQFKESRLIDETYLIKRELLKLKSSVDRLGEDIRRSHSNLLPDTYRFLAQEKGVDAEVATELVQNIFLKLEGANIRDHKKIRQALHKEIISNIQINNRLDIHIGRPKIVCLVGPTGVGKTTSLIKMATHPQFYGKKRVGIITIDTYRVAAAAQLKTFAALARLPLEIVYEPGDLAAALEKLQNTEVILVDTAGRSPFNDQHLEDLKQFFAQSTPDETHLVLAVSMRSDIQLDTVETFSALPVNNLILSKIDETQRLGNIFNVGRKIELPISFLTNGQKVPDDIQIADKNLIADLILN